MVRIAREPTGGKGHKVEEFNSPAWTAQNTGGDPHRRRLANDYRKGKQVPGGEHDFPNIAPEVFISAGQKP